MFKDAAADAATQAPGEAAFAPVELIAGDAARRLVLLCDHASNRIPDRYGQLGLSPEDLERHVAYDIGAGALTRALAADLGAPAVLSRFSRLLVDPNRGVDDPTLIMCVSDGLVVPANRHVDARETARRLALYYEPYHQAIDDVIDEVSAAGKPPALVSIHSFTPVWRGIERPWHVGILWDRDARLAQPLLHGLRGEPGLVVGDNEPYSGELRGDTLYRHGTRRGLAHAVVEVRQDLIETAQGVDRWAARLGGHLRRILKRDGLHTIRPAADTARGRAGAAKGG